MKHLLNIFLFLVFTAICHAQDESLIFDPGVSLTYAFSSDTVEMPQKILDTVDAVVLIADWENQTTKWQFVKAICTGHTEYINKPIIEDFKNGVAVSYLVYHTTETTIWDKIEFWRPSGTIWEIMDKKRILIYHFKPDE